MIPDQRVIENIKKLKGLGMSDDEIIDNLVKMGMSKEDSKELLNKSEGKTNETTVKKDSEIKQEKNIEVKKQELPDDFFSSDKKIQKKEETKDKLDLTSKEDELDITQGLDLDKLDSYSKDSNEIEEINKEKDITLDNKDNVKPSEINFDLNDNNKEKIDTQEEDGDIWKSGLATTLNSKLSEIDSKQKLLEEYIKQELKQELIKFNKIQNSEKQLMIANIKDTIKTNIESMKSGLAKDIAHIKIIDVKLNNKIKNIAEDKEELNKLMNKVNSANSQVKEIASKTQESISRSTKINTIKLNAKMKDINDTLALQSRIIHGLVQNTQNAIKKELDKINNFEKEIQKKINPKELYDKLSELEEFKQKLANRYEEKFENVKIEFLNKAKTAFKNEINEQLGKVNKITETIVAKTDPEIINKKLKELKDFEQELTSSIDLKITQSLRIYESTITQEFKEKINEIEKYRKELDMQISTGKILDEKIRELDKFKEQFIAVIDKNIEKMNKNIQYVDEKVKEIKGEK